MISKIVLLLLCSDLLLCAARPNAFKNNGNYAVIRCRDTDLLLRLKAAKINFRCTENSKVLEESYSAILPPSPRSQDEEVSATNELPPESGATPEDSDCDPSDRYERCNKTNTFFNCQQPEGFFDPCPDPQCYRNLVLGECIVKS